MSKINVTKTFLPPKEEYFEYLRRIWDGGQLTNQGPVLLELEEELERYLRVENLHFVTNGTLALQLAIRALGLEQGEIITTPFSYVATSSAILWEGFTPRYVDIEPETYCIDSEKIEEAINKETRAILAVHVFGFPCNIKGISAIAKKHNLKVIYDAAHAFGVKYEGKSIFNQGDISISSFHATKLFHTIEGGCVVAKSKAMSKKVDLLKRFGHNGDSHLMLGINAKATEVQAAMGLCNLKYIDDIIKERKKLTKLYTNLLPKSCTLSSGLEDAGHNSAYLPILLDSEKKLSEVVQRLNRDGIYPRRYFYPSLNTISYIRSNDKCPISEDISKRILCLPLYSGLKKQTIKKICEIIDT